MYSMVDFITGWPNSNLVFYAFRYFYWLLEEFSSHQKHLCWLFCQCLWYAVQQSILIVIYFIRPVKTPSTSSSGSESSSEENEDDSDEESESESEAKNKKAAAKPKVRITNLCSLFLVLQLCMLKCECIHLTIHPSYPSSLLFVHPSVHLPVSICPSLQ